MMGRSKTILTETLRISIRRAADRQHGRNIPLEDQFRQILSWSTLNGDDSGVYLVRIAAIDANGKHVIGGLADGGTLQQGVVDTLYNETYRNLCRNINKVLVRDETPEMYKKLYHPGSLDHTDFLYTENWPPHVRNIVCVG
jgi:hypothetical protein